MGGFDLQLFADEPQNVGNTDTAATPTQSTVAETETIQPTYFQQVEQLTKSEIQNRLQALKEEETVLLEAAKKFEEEERAKVVAYVKDHCLEVGLLAIVLLKLFGVIR